MDGSLKSVPLGSQVLSQIPVQIISTAHAQTSQQGREINNFVSESSGASFTSFFAQNCASGFGEWSLLTFHVCLLYLKLFWNDTISYLTDNPTGSSRIKNWISFQKMQHGGAMQFPTACNSVRKALTPKGICLLSTQGLLAQHCWSKGLSKAQHRTLPCFTGAGRNTHKSEFLGSWHPQHRAVSELSAGYKAHPKQEAASCWALCWHSDPSRNGGHSFLESEPLTRVTGTAATAV